MNIFKWFLWIRVIDGKNIMYVTKDAPLWENLKDSPLVQKHKIDGMYRLVSF
jgi:hypothetical protein